MINVTMDGDAIVISPTGRLDGETTSAVEHLLRAASAAGAIAIVDVSRVDRRDRAVAAALAESARVTPASVA